MNAGMINAKYVVNVKTKTVSSEANSEEQNK